MTKMLSNGRETGKGRRVVAKIKNKLKYFIWLSRNRCCREGKMKSKLSRVPRSGRTLPGRLCQPTGMSALRLEAGTESTRWVGRATIRNQPLPVSIKFPSAPIHFSRLISIGGELIFSGHLFLKGEVFIAPIGFLTAGIHTLTILCIHVNVEQISL